MVWIGLTGDGHVLGPHFVQVNFDTREYLRIMRYDVVQQDFQNLRINRFNVWWQQDGAPAHISNASLRYQVIPTGSHVTICFKNLIVHRNDTVINFRCS